MFKPLTGSEEGKWLEEKYADIDYESSKSCKTSRSKKDTRPEHVTVQSKCSSSNTKASEKQQGKKRCHGFINNLGDREKQAESSESDVEIIEEEKNIPQNDSLFKPLRGNEEAERLEVKYKTAFEAEDEVQKCSTAKKPKLTFITSENTPGKCRGTLKNVDSTKKPITPIQSEIKAQRLAALEYSPDTGEDKSFTHIKHNAGFDAEEFEKPRFRGRIPPAAKVPFKLSNPRDDRQIEVPAPLNQHLRDYQREGIIFLYDHYKEGKGALLGDDMGLGKTVQVIGLLAALLGKKCNKTDIMKQKPRFIREMSDDSLEEKLEEDTIYRCRPFLIIGPGSVLYNWMDELEVWGYFTVGKYHGGEKSECLSKLEKQSLEIVVTTFETFRENLSELNSVEWEAVITDEVHRIKGLKAQVTNALRSIKTRRRFGLTGTALQNNMRELWSILDWVQPGCLGSIDLFTEEFVVPIETGQKRDATKRELAMARKVKEKFAAIRNKIMLRRTKQLIADQLPQKDDNVVFCRLSDLQEQVYQFTLEHPGLVHVMSMDDPCHCGSGEPRKNCCKQVTKEVTVTGLQFIFMHLLLKVSNHAALLIENPHRELSKYSKMVCKAVFEEFPHFYNHTKESAFRTLSDPKYCGKMRILQRLLKVFQRDHSKVLIFSYSTRVLDIIDQYLITTGYEYRRLDGSTSMSKRSMLVREFNRDPNIFLFLISAKAGGLGLNLTGANRVIIFDPSWNPTNDLQAQDRAYRIGQWRDVHVYRLISSGTIEENIYLRQVYKQQLDSVAVGTENARRYFRGIAGDRKRYGELFGIKNMFQLHTGDSSRTMEILRQNENLEQSLTEFRMAKYVPGASRRFSVEEDEMEDMIEESQTGEEEDEDYLSRYLDLHHSDSEAEEVKGKMSEVKIKRKNSKGKDSPTKEGTLLGEEDVVHVLKNRKIVGGSRAEDHMSRCAMQDVFELHQNSQELAAHCQPLSEPDSEEDKKQNKRKQQTSYTTTIGNKTVLIGQTPPLIRMKHFQEMTEFKKKKTMVEFAEEVLKSSSQERKNILECFYKHIHPDITQVFLQKEPIRTTTTSETSNRTGQSPMDSNKERQRKKRKGVMQKSPIKPSSCAVSKETIMTEVKKQGVKAVRKSKPPLFVPSYIEINEDETMDASHNNADFSTDDLLQEIAKQSDEKIAEVASQKEEKVTEMDEGRVRVESEGPSTSETSVLDELFSSSFMARIQRKPAPKKNRQGKTTCDGSDELFSDSSSAKEEVGDEGRIRVDNTLKDDDLDCFTDPSRKKRKGSRAQKIVSRLIEESEATYNRLPKVAIGSQLDQVESCDRSPSLF
ncbi:DNA excision repair protein ERCC-6-like 2 [Saccostrea echinata]|uniref:DNA excision repair protein ERCC-6-like 2 n=1 Tax=Saccostrea echinata TaxID=191078 RepID=UPI002A7FB2FA|nr:DNA excision repair protein ERCC-6-like 2 [Saccostrea echinata]